MLKKRDVSLVLSANNIDYKETARILIKLNETLNTTVTVTVNNKTYDVKVIDGNGKLELSKTLTCKLHRNRNITKEMTFTIM